MMLSQGRRKKKEEGGGRVGPGERGAEERN